MNNSGEHNKLQAKFLDDAFCLRLWKYMFPTNNDQMQIEREFNSIGFDVVLHFNTSSFLRYTKGTFQIKIEPVLGNEYSSILSSLKLNKKENNKVILLVDKYKASILQEQMIKIFNNEGIDVVFFCQF